MSRSLRPGKCSILCLRNFIPHHTRSSEHPRPSVVCVEVEYDKFAFYATHWLRMRTTDDLRYCPQYEQMWWLSTIIKKVTPHPHQAVDIWGVPSVFLPSS